MRTAIALTLCGCALVAACGRTSSSAGPQGWQPLRGTPAAWSSGAGPRAQTYRYSNRPFNGTLQDLASSVTIDVLLHHRGAKLRRSVPFAPCPGTAGVATFVLPSGETLEEGFAAGDKRAIRTSYTRAPEAPADPNVVTAMQKALCIAPG